MKQFFKDYFDIICMKKCYNDFPFWYATLLDFFVVLPFYIIFGVFIFNKK